MTKDTSTPADTFDLDAWIDGARLPERAVTVYGRGDLAAEYADLDAQLHAEQASMVDDERMSGTVKSRLAKRMTVVRDEMQASARTFRLRAITREEQVALREGAPKDEDGDPDGAHMSVHWLAVACIEPTLTPEQAGRLRERIGEGQWEALCEAAFEATHSRTVAVPFSLAHSAALRITDS